MMFLMIIFLAVPITWVQAKDENNSQKSSRVEKDNQVKEAKTPNKNNSQLQQLNKLIDQELSRENFKKVPKEITDSTEIEKQAEFASQITGVRKDFLMGMLVVESDLGRNTGKCTYQEVREGAEAAHSKGRLSKQAWKTFLERKKIIQDIANGLGYDADRLKVSCNPPYAGTGGAMGMAQFMPDTWIEYKDKVAKIVGTDNPDPWSARDGVLAMALKVADVPGVIEHDVYAERRASKMYLSGTVSSRYEWYASEIQYWSRNYQDLIG